jgi:hypothetical protein
VEEYEEAVITRAENERGKKGKNDYIYDYKWEQVATIVNCTALIGGDERPKTRGR